MTWPRVTSRRPCSVCHHPSFCQVSPDGTLAKCMRVSDGAFKTGTSSLGTYYLHRLAGDADVRHALASTAPRPVATPHLRDVVYSFILEPLTLSPEHVAQLHQRGLNEEAIVRNNSATAASRERMSALVSRLAQRCDLAGVPGLTNSESGWRFAAEEGDLLIPVRDARFRIIALRRRSDSSERRYSWVSSKFSPSGSPAHHAEPWNVEFRPVLCATEGELKADVIAHRLGFTTAGLPGVGSVPPGFGSTLRDAYPSVRSVFVAFDADVATNPRVQEGRNRLTRALKAVNFSVHLLEWCERDGKGLDDVLARSTAA
jgi:DNA primase